MLKTRAIQVTSKDNVATVLANTSTGTTVEVFDKHNKLMDTIVLKNDISYGNKLALVQISTGTPIIKYGSKIGIAIKDIEIGEIVHVHNVDSFISVIPESVRHQVITEMGIEV